MTLISEEGKAFTVVVRLDCEPEIQEKLVELSREMMSLFARQPGFISKSLHRRLDNRGLLTYLQWEREADHLACQANPEIAEAGKELMTWVSEGKVTIDIGTYEVLATKNA